MVDPIAASRFSHRILFLGLAAAILFVRILPLSTLPSRFPAPDLLLCLTFVWIQRRPDYVPALLVAGVFLLDDLMAARPPGLWAVIVLLGTEFLRTREATLRDLPFALEWLMTSAVFTAMTLANWLVLAIFMVPQTDFGTIILHMLTTIIAYPAVALATLLAIGLRKAAKGEVDALGHRL